ncbi:hypothetical protein G9A89_017339 [Geosiphon pyriformis]|nr:hypothetical protein G9A89_017339 [Geosiphon pyriformis]
MKATQYQALIENDWLFKTNATLDWNTQKLQLSQNGQHTQIPTMFLWTDIDHNKLPPILAWDNNDNEKKKQRKESTWKATINAWTDNNQSKMPPILDWEEKNKKKGKEREENIPEETTTHQTKTTKHESITIASPTIGNDMITQKDKTNGTTNYVSLVENNYLIKEYKTTFLVKEEHRLVEGTSPKEILEIKNNSSEPTDIVLVLNPDVFIDIENSPEEFHEHYQNLAPTREEQKQHLKKINT